MSTNGTRRTPLAGKAKIFGPADCLLGVSNPTRSKPSGTGAILWGLGVAEVKTARRLAGYGIPSLQVRIDGPDFYDDVRRNAKYRRYGPELCKAAMDELGSDEDVGSFILMGNCACANLCFNAALQDPRVTGLIITNPYISMSQLLRTVPLHLLLTRLTWQKVKSGQFNVRKHASKLAAQARRCVLQNRRSDDSVKASVNGASPRLELPDDLAGELARLSARGANVLLACSTTDDSTHYLRKKNVHKKLDRLQSRGRLTFTEVGTRNHVFSTDDEAADLLNDAISAWVHATFGAGADDRARMGGGQGRGSLDASAQRAYPALRRG